MVQRVVVENVIGHITGRYARKLEREFRINSYFPQSVTGTGSTLLGAVHGSKYTVESYAHAFNGLVGTCSNVIEGKLFRLPKLLLLPGMLMNQPWLVVTVLPASVFLDVGRTKVVGSMTKRIEKMSKEVQELASRRQKMEQHDTKHEELIRRGSSSGFAEGQWREIAMEIEGKALRTQALKSLRDFINHLYHKDALDPGFEVVISWLLQFGHITVTDIFLYLRVVQDAIDLLLTRFRMDARLASMRTEVDRVRDLLGRLAAVRERGRAACDVRPEGGEGHIGGLRYARGNTVVSIPDLVLRSGRVYAVTGANGCGKSSFFGILASCGRLAAVLPSGLEIQELGGLVLPSDDVVEITQQLYCPLHVRPLEWLLQRRGLDGLPAPELAARQRRAEGLLAELEFGEQGHAGRLNASALLAPTEDWYGTLSGGQRGKVEFVRKVFLRDRCPGVLLIDEAFAPLDPRSKQLVQRRLKEFCAESLVLVIYHGDADSSCVAGGGFFDESLHFANGSVSLAPTC
ncbi:unnamed protein product [Prorocentrum cordatum]|uniref:AAA+ ATPase domain-containing protein n=1 Tax=Prorocentrum cordatum TaxID=2364126 RepID=A0ABN9QYJ4_9DINO|nr:unnamed protein product [Polarella glacialis]